ncbi:selenium metabolism-associated LysR family transcriptional regulator [Desulfonatronospira sp.]|uniref:selenium metabolism-associated LysR family transcriptional regulator n=1 Tax=Desulfonatronospira sp. TaxID=1962951 RepID=UPI0025C0B826|nr:selenium metabolism-associated LysR family transcriptional regulator [Desulfonatronospira sp.]
MEFRKLQAFARVYELQSFSLAARDLFLSQPTISTHIISLEEDLRVSLFDRIGRKVIPTQAGEILYRGVRDVFRIMDEARSGIQELTKQVSGLVTIGGSTIPANYLLPGVLASYRQLHPDVCVDLRIADSIQISHEVLEGRIDFGLVGGFAEHFDLENYLLFTDELMVVAPPGLAASYAHGLTPYQLSDIPWVMREKGSGTRQALEKALQEHRVDVCSLPAKALVQSTEAMIRCVLSGMGAGVTSRLAVDELINSGQLVTLEVSELNMSRQFYLIKHKRRTLFLCASMLMQHIRRELSLDPTS